MTKRLCATAMMALLFPRLAAKRFQSFDVLACPTTAEQAPVYDPEKAYGPDGPQTVGGVPVTWLSWGFTMPYDFSGYPTLSLPNGQSPEGMPLSLQLVGKPLAEALSLQVGQAYETATRWHLWHNVLTAEVLFDRNGWYTKLQRRVRVPFPKELRDAIVRHNYPLLRDRQSSFTKQIVGAAKRKDAIALNHRIAAFLASYFDVLFAVNGKPHPGEKRLLLHARQLNHFPPNLPVQLADLFSAASNCDDVVLAARLAEIVLELKPILSQTAL